MRAKPSDGITQSEPHELALDRKHVAVRDVRGVAEYLGDYPEAIALIIRAVDAVLKHAPDADLILDLYSDPEISDRYLLLIARTSDDSVELLDRIEAEYIHSLEGKPYWLQVLLETVQEARQ